MTKSEKFYITTPIYYVNDIPHIGHAYTTVLADVITRYQRLLGNNTFFMTGTDEHGQKVQQAAAKREIDPKQHVDEYNVRFKDLWQKLNIKYDKFIRTTDADHIRYVQERLQQLYDKDEIYTKVYSGWYSVGEERFFNEDELVDGKDPVSGKPVEWIEEKNYFFRMGNYKDKLLEHIEKNPDFILPDFRKNEVLGFLKKDLNDLCISRPKSRLSWGIPLPFDDDYVTYVWFDALLNYVSGVAEQKTGEGDSLWPATYHIIGKDILTTHSVYWTTMLFAMNIPLPDHILAHGWWMNGGAKMSKSSGTAIDPIPYIEKFGVDVFRYFLISDMVIGQDASFSDESFIKRVNSDLANDLGNCLNRVYKQVLSHFDGILPPVGPWDDTDEALKKMAEDVVSQVLPLIEEVRLSQAVDTIFTLIRYVNKYIDDKAPWKLAKDPDQREALATVLTSAAEALRISLILLSPIMPEKCKQGLSVFSKTEISVDGLAWGALKGGEEIKPCGALFPRIEVKKEKQKQKGEQVAPKNPLALVELRVAEIVEVIPHPDAEALYAMKVDTGSEVRSVCAGIRKAYEVADLQNKRVVLVANLKPAKLRGIESKGMLLAGGGDTELPKLIDPGNIPLGTLLQFGDVTPDPKAKLSSKDLAKITMTVKDKVVSGNDQSLHFEGNNVTCTAQEGAVVR